MGLIIMMIRYLVLMVALIEAATAATTHQVGDSVGWAIPPNASFYATWASAQKFSVGDTLEFQWTSTHNVLEVTKTEYEDCSGMNGTPSSSSPVRITLTNTTARYFICTVGTHCASGQKLAVTNVAETNSTTTPTTSGPPPPPSGASASMPTTAAALLPALLSTMAMISFLVITI